MGLEIAQPLRLVALAVLPLLLYYGWRSLPGFARWQRTVSLAIRILLVAVLVVALCDVRLTTDTRQLFVVFAIDESLSISEASGKAAETFINEALADAGDNRSARLPFALGPGENADRRGTNLAAAIAEAQAFVESGCVPRVVLLSDGNQTAGDALATAEAAAMPVWTVPLADHARDEVYVSAVQTQAEVRQGEPFDVEVVVRSTRESEGTVRLMEGAEEVVGRQERVIEGENRFRFRHTLTGESEAVLTAELVGFADTLPENNRASALVFVAARPRVMLVEGRGDLSRPLAEALRQQYIDVEIRTADEMPDRPGELEDYELLMLANVPAVSLSAGRMEAVRAYVRDFGGGLIVVGGDRALTAGGYRGTLLEEVLPLQCEVGKDRPQPSLAMVLVIDRSASMEGESIELARQATRLAVEKLAQRDQVGVIAFEDNTHWITDGVQPCSDKKLILQQIGSITAGGGTNLYPAMEKAYLALSEAFADRKHMIVLSDGLSHPGDFEELTKDIAVAGITVSTVAVGREAAEQLLQDIADRGSGQYYFCRSAAALPGVFVLEATTAGKMGVVEQLVAPQVVDAEGLLSELAMTEVPPLLGYVETVAKPNSRLALSAENGDPLLAWWRYGRGTSMGFTSTVESNWAPLWLDWPGLGPFWAELVRHAMRKDEPEGFALRVERRDGRARLTLDAIDRDGRYINGAEATLEIVDPGSQRRKLPLAQVAPGRYGADFDTPTPGPYRLRTTLDRGGQTAHAGRVGLVVGYADELRLRPTDEDLLRTIAQSTGGRYDPRPGEVFARPEETVRRTTPCWPYLLMAAALIFLIDVTLKRIDLTRGRS